MNAPQECQCKICGRMFLYVASGKGYSKQRCHTCKKRERTNKLKQKMVDYKGGKCCMCGYHRSLRALQFHHKDPTSKLGDLSDSFRDKSWVKIIAELDKTVLLCSNCHAEEHEIQDAVRHILNKENIE